VPGDLQHENRLRQTRQTRPRLGHGLQAVATPPKSRNSGPSSQLTGV
jgi:hypothetical protein